MLVVRRTIQVKDGTKFIEMVKSWPDLGLPSPPHAHRIYTYGPASPWGLVIWEQEFESMAEKEAFDKEYWAIPAAHEQVQVFMSLVESRGSTTEIWTVEHLE